MKRGTKRFFNMIELAVVIAISAIVLTSVVAIMPTGLKNENKAKTGYYVSDLASSAHSFISGRIARQVKMDIAANPDSSIDSIWQNAISSLIPSSIPDEYSNTGLTGKEAEWGNNPVNNIIPIDENNGIYGIKIATNGTTDIMGELRVWQQNTENFNGTKIGDASATYNINNGIAGINLEISAPVGRPYAAREKFKYYFEVFNSVSPAKQDYSVTEGVSEDIDEGGDDIISRDDPGEITVNKNSILKITIVDTQFYKWSSYQKTPVYVRVCVTLPDDTTGTVYNCFEETQTTSGHYEYQRVGWKWKQIWVPGETITVEKAVNEGDYWEMEVPSGTKFTVQAFCYNSSETSIYSSYWSTNENQVLTLINGDTPPAFQPGNGQISPEACISEYVDDDGLVTLNSNQILYLYELGQTVEFYSNGSRNSGFDRQDVIVLAELTTNS